MLFRTIAFSLSLLALLLLLAGGPGYRLGLWDLGFGFLGVMRYATYLGAAGALLGLIGLCWPKMRGQGAGLLVMALLLGLLVVAVPITVRQGAAQVPPIHDITTDTNDPPAFVAVEPLRADAPNPVEYAGEETAAQQREAYPALQTAIFSADPQTVFQAARETVDELGWEPVAAVAEQGRIEATDTTLWYGFKDDVVIRIRERSGSTHVDVRSKSRIGRSDLGKNAQRIESFLKQVEYRLKT